MKPWSNKNQIYCLRNNKIFSSNLSGIAQERYFYKLQDLTKEEIEYIYRLGIDPSPDVIKPAHEEFLQGFVRVFNAKKFVLENGLLNDDIEKELNKMIINMEEDYHSRIEDVGKPFLNKIGNSDISFFSDDEQRMAFLIFVAVQYMRTKKRRSASVNIVDQKILNMRRIWPILSHIYATNIAMALHTDKEYIMIKIVNDTNVDFITGDQPLINTYGVYSNEILETDELEFYYPIAPKLSILITKSKQHSNNTIKLSDEQTIHSYNDMIVASCEDQVYASSKEHLKSYQSKGDINDT